MFDISSFTRPTITLASRLNAALGDIYGHGGDVGGFRFVGRGPSTAYLKVPGDPKGAVCVSWEDGDHQVVTFWHPSRTGKEAWQLSATSEGCRALCSDEDMDEDRFWSVKSGWEYVVVRACIARFPGCGGESPHKMRPATDEELGM